MKALPLGLYLELPARITAVSEVKVAAGIGGDLDVLGDTGEVFGDGSDRVECRKHDVYLAARIRHFDE